MTEHCTRKPSFLGDHNSRSLDGTPKPLYQPGSGAQQGVADHGHLHLDVGGCPQGVHAPGHAALCAVEDYHLLLSVRPLVDAHLLWFTSRVCVHRHRAADALGIRPDFTLLEHASNARRIAVSRKDGFLPPRASGVVICDRLEGLHQKGRPILRLSCRAQALPNLRNLEFTYPLWFPGSPASGEVVLPALTSLTMAAAGYSLLESIVAPALQTVTLRDEEYGSYSGLSFEVYRARCSI